MVKSRLVLRHVQRSPMEAEMFGHLDPMWGYLPQQPDLTYLALSNHREGNFLMRLVQRLPGLIEEACVREAFDDAFPDDGSGAQLMADMPPAALRAAVVCLGFVAHGARFEHANAVRAGTEAESAWSIPAHFVCMWAVGCKRLGRKEPFLSTADYYMWNYRRSFVSSTLFEPICQMFGSNTECIFGGTNVAVVCVLGPTVGAMVRAQEAVAADDADAVCRELEAIWLCLTDSVKVFNHLTVNEADHCCSVNPVLWAQTVARFATPWKPGAPGISGMNMAMQALDNFMGRTVFDSVLGAEALELREFLAPNWRAFVTAIGDPAVSVLTYVRDRKESNPRCVRGFETGGRVVVCKYFCVRVRVCVGACVCGFMCVCVRVRGPGCGGCAWCQQQRPPPPSQRPQLILRLLARACVAAPFLLLRRRASVDDVTATALASPVFGRRLIGSTN